jgi:ferric-dicitrate binding protein FerR (iron transport regulator)
MLRSPLFYRASLLVVLAGLSLPAMKAEALGCEKVARLMSLQGKLSRQESDTQAWESVTPEQDFCLGERIHTGDQSRATLELSNKTYVTIEQQTTIVFVGDKPRMPSWIDVLKGLLYVRSRTPSSFGVRTPYINAVIKGTEFLVSADDNEGQVTVLEGAVESSNAQGTLTLTDGQAAVAKAG